MFSKNGTRTDVIEDHKATLSNLKLVLLSSKTSLLGDPDFGSMLKTKLFSQDSPILQDLLIDDIYSTIITFMPQISLSRKDITVTTDNIDVYVTIKGVNLIDYELDTYTINLTA